jgi:hypothetical protein
MPPNRTSFCGANNPRSQQFYLDFSHQNLPTQLSFRMLQRCRRADRIESRLRILGRDVLQVGKGLGGVGREAIKGRKRLGGLVGLL